MSKTKWKNIKNQNTYFKIKSKTKLNKKNQTQIIKTIKK